MPHGIIGMVFILALLAAPAWAADPAADIKNVQGQVEVRRGGGSFPAVAGGVLEIGDVLATGKDGSAGLSFRDGSRVSLGVDSEFRVDAYAFEPQEKQYAMNVFLRKGVAAISSGKMAALSPESMKVSTPLATLGIRGTRFLVRAR